MELIQLSQANMSNFSKAKISGGGIRTPLILKVLFALTNILLQITSVEETTYPECISGQEK